MQPDGLRSQPGGGGTLYHETPEAWEILAILGREQLPMEKMLELLAGFHSSDLHAAYWLTRQRAELVRRDLLVDGEDAGRGIRIRARNILARARRQSMMVEQTQLMGEEAKVVLDEIRGCPPPRTGTHLRSVLQVLILAGSAQPLSVRMRRLLLIHPDRLEAARLRILTLPDTAWLRKGWPSRLERPHLRRVLELASQLQRELLANRET